MRPGDIEDTDLLFLDLERSYDALAEHLQRYARKARRYIVVPDTTKFGHYGEKPGGTGLWPAVEEFLSQGVFALKERITGHGGLTILERDPRKLST